MLIELCCHLLLLDRTEVTIYLPMECYVDIKVLKEKKIHLLNRKHFTRKFNTVKVYLKFKWWCCWWWWTHLDDLFESATSDKFILLTSCRRKRTSLTFAIEPLERYYFAWWHSEAIVRLIIWSLGIPFLPNVVDVLFSSSLSLSLFPSNE